MEGTHAIRNNRRFSGTAATGNPMAQEVKPALKNKSEILFEAYLRSQGHTDCAFEPEIQGTSRRPDYRLSWSEQDILFEVKEFRAAADDFGSGFFDPYPPLREKINAARDKFKSLKQYCCCLVLYNRDKPLVLLDWQPLSDPQPSSPSGSCVVGNNPPWRLRRHAWEPRILGSDSCS